MFKGSFKGVSRKFQGCSKKFSNQTFLAATSSSRSDIVTECVFRPYPFFSLVSLKSVENLEC